VRDHNGQQLAYVYYESEPGRRSAAKLLTKDEAWRCGTPAFGAEIAAGKRPKRYPASAAMIERLGLPRIPVILSPGHTARGGFFCLNSFVQAPSRQTCADL
jgi:hypothetical protein